VDLVCHLQPDPNKVYTMKLQSLPTKFSCSAITAVVVACFYFSTLMWDINGSDLRYAVDIGEYQVAMSLWGTVHPTGTPLYMMLGSPVVTMLDYVGVAPTAGASLFSLFWAVGSVILVVMILLKMSVPPVLAAGFGVVIGLTKNMWIHASIAEVYSLWIFLLLLALYIALKLEGGWSDKMGWILALVAGLGCAHHRLFAPMLPVLAVWLWPLMPRGNNLIRWGVIAIAMFAVGFLPYLDIIRRASNGSQWIYGDPNSWEGFWSIFWAKEASGLQGLPTDIDELISAAYKFVQIVNEEFLWSGILLVVFGLPFALVRPFHRRIWLFVLTAIAYVLFAACLPRTGLFDQISMIVVISTLMVSGVGIARIGRKLRYLNMIVLVVMLSVSYWFVVVNRPLVLDITRDPSGLQVISELTELKAPDSATIMSPWGRRHFALSYATQVDGIYPGWNILHHAENWSQILERDITIYTNTDSIYGFGPDWWTNVLGYQPYISSAGYGWIAISRNELPMLVDNKHTIKLGNNIYLQGWTFNESNTQLDVMLCWSTLVPTEIDYSTFVHLAVVEEIIVPEQLVASSDHYAPIENWRPTSSWNTEEVVCDSHTIIDISRSDYKYIFAGMYTSTSAGEFNQLGKITWVRDDNGWTPVRE